MRGRVTFSLVLVGTGTALAAGGPEALIGAVHFGWENLAVLLFVVGGVAMLAGVVPSGSLAGPAVLLLLGTGVLVVRSGWSEGVGRYGAATALVGLGLLIAVEPGTRRALDLRRRRWAVVFPRTVVASTAPACIRLVAVGNRLTVDLSGSAHAAEVLEIFISSWLGQVGLTVPPDWAVVAGRVTVARGVRLHGRLDSKRDFTDPAGDDLERLENLVKKDTTSVRSCVAVIHVLGLGGSVRVARRAV